MKKAAIIGGFGNIGQGIVRRFLEDGYDVTVITHPRAVPEALRDARVMEVHGRGRDEQFVQAMRREKFEYVVDLACYTQEDARADCEAFAEAKHVAVTSSGASYGALPGAEIPIRESMLQKPTWIYGIQKKEMEEVFWQEHRRTGFPITIFRPTVTYGRQKVIVRQIASDNSWIDRIRKGKPIVVGNPYILRNFLYVDDAAGAFAGAMRHDCVIGQAYNLCGLRPYDWGTYHRTMMEVLGREVETVEVPLDLLKACPSFEVSDMITTNFIYNGYYSGEKIARDIPEFCPQTDLKEGLARTVAMLDEAGLIPNSDAITWEDEIIRAQRRALQYWS